MRISSMVAVPIVFLVGCVSLRPKYTTYTFSMAGAELNRESIIECGKLDRKVAGWTVGGIVAGGLSGAAGLSLSLVENEIAKWTISAGTAALSTVGAVGSYLAIRYAQRYTEKCTENKGGRD